jgi:hypothetical protein
MIINNRLPPLAVVIGNLRRLKKSRVDAIKEASADLINRRRFNNVLPGT